MSCNYPIPYSNLNKTREEKAQVPCIPTSVCLRFLPPCSFGLDTVLCSVSLTFLWTSLCHGSWHSSSPFSGRGCSEGEIPLPPLVCLLPFRSQGSPLAPLHTVLSSQHLPSNPLSCKHYSHWEQMRKLRQCKAGELGRGCPVRMQQHWGWNPGRGLGSCGWPRAGHLRLRHR